jgi:PTH1 family peptidyl-tRNA hydrolase
MGIGKPEHKGEVASYVLSQFTQPQECLDDFISHVADSVEYLLEHSLEDTRCRYSQKGLQC